MQGVSLCATAAGRARGWPWLCTMLVIYWVVDKIDRGSRLLEPSVRTEEGARKELVSVSVCQSGPEARLRDTDATDRILLGLHDRVLVLFFEVTLPATKGASIV